MPAALYKALGGFATNGINMTKLESYQLEGQFYASQFYADVEGHPDERGLKFALEELAFFSHEVRILGVYPASPSARRSASRTRTRDCVRGSEGSQVLDNLRVSTRRRIPLIAGNAGTFSRKGRRMGAFSFSPCGRRCPVRGG